MSERIQVLEYCTPQIRGGVIRGVKIIGIKSRNGRTYPRQVLRQAVALYESTPVFMFHPDDREKQQNSRSLTHHFGNLQNVHERNGGKKGFGLFGNLHVKMSHPMAEAVIEQVESGEAKFGLSHNAMCDMSEDKRQVLKIVEVNSVDLVDNPGTTDNLFEEENMATITEIADADDKGDKPELSTILEGIAKDLTSQAADLAAMKADLAKLQPGDPPGKKKKPEDRLSVLEDRTGGEGGEGPPPIGNTHEDFLGAMRGFSVTN